MNTKETTLHFILREDKKDKHGKAPVFLRITRERKTSYRTMGLKVYVSEWDKVRGRVNRSHANSVRFNQLLEERRSEAEALLLQAYKEDQNLSSLGLKEQLLQNTDVSFHQLCREKIAYFTQREQFGTASRYKVVLNKIIAFIGSDRELLLGEIDYAWLEQFDNFLTYKLKNQVNTVHSTIKCVRSIINDAIRKGIFEVQKNPFLRFRIKREATNIESLSEEELLEFNKHIADIASHQYLHQQLFLFACYCGGIRISDLLMLKKSNIKDGRIQFTMRKTNRQIRFAIPPVAMEIVQNCNKDIANDSFLFPILNDRPLATEKEIMNAISISTVLVNKSLKAIARKLGWNRNLHFHMSRHTFATMALRKGIRIEYVSSILGHSTIKETQRYAKVGSRELDEAMMRL